MKTHTELHLPNKISPEAKSLLREVPCSVYKVFELGVFLCDGTVYKIIKNLKHNSFFLSHQLLYSFGNKHNLRCSLQYGREFFLNNKILCLFFVAFLYIRYVSYPF